MYPSATLPSNIAVVVVGIRFHRNPHIMKRVVIILLYHISIPEDEVGALSLGDSQLDANFSYQIVG